MLSMLCAAIFFLTLAILFHLLGKDKYDLSFDRIKVLFEQQNYTEACSASLDLLMQTTMKISWELLGSDMYIDVSRMQIAQLNKAITLYRDTIAKLPLTPESASTHAELLAVVFGTQDEITSRLTSSSLCTRSEWMNQIQKLLELRLKMGSHLEEMKARVGTVTEVMPGTGPYTSR